MLRSGLAWLTRSVLGRNPLRRPRRSRRGPPRDPEYRAWIRSFPCCSCGVAWPVEAAHTGSDGGMRQKASDYSCVPLCVLCHAEYHRIGKPDFERWHAVKFEVLVVEFNEQWAEERAA